MIKKQKLIKLKNAEFEIDIVNPGSTDSYKGPRFSWAGIISNLSWRGVKIFGSWREGEFALDLHNAVSGTAGEFGMGIDSMPCPLGYETAKPGDVFLKIGVGLLRKCDAFNYDFTKQYKLIKSFPWQVMINSQKVTMLQKGAHGEFAYEYQYIIELNRNNSSFVTKHELKNTGNQDIHQTHYSHNFFTIGGKTTGPGYELEFPFYPEIYAEFDNFVLIDKKKIRFNQNLTGAIFSILDGHTASVDDNAVIIRNNDIGIEISVQGDHSLSNYHLFATPQTICPEPFIEFNLIPGVSTTWQHNYEFRALKKIF